MNRHKLEQAGLCYPQAGLSGITHAGFVNSVNFPEREKSIRALKPDFNAQNSPYALAPGQSSELFFNELEQLVAGSGASKFLLSSECFFEWTDPHYFAGLFNSLFNQTRVIIYLREQVSWMDSVYNQLIKDPYFKYSGKVMDLPQLSLIAYDKILDNWEDAFGRDSLWIKIYHAQARKDIVSDLLKSIGLESDGDWDWPDVARHNISLHPALARMVAELNRQVISSQARDKIVTMAADLSADIPDGDADTLLTAQEIEQIRSISKGCNDRLNEKYGIIFDE